MTSSKTATLDKMTFAVLDSKTTNVTEMNCAASNSKKGHHSYVLHYFEQHKLLMGFKIHSSGSRGLSLLRQVERFQKCRRVHFFSFSNSIFKFHQNCRVSIQLKVAKMTGSLNRPAKWLTKKAEHSLCFWPWVRQAAP